MVKTLKYRSGVRYWEKDETPPEGPDYKRNRASLTPYAIKKSTLTLTSKSSSRVLRTISNQRLLPRSRKPGGRHRPIKVKEIFDVTDVPDTPNRLQVEEEVQSLAPDRHVLKIKSPTDELITAVKLCMERGIQDWAEKHEYLSTCRVVAVSTPRPSELNRLFQKLEEAEKAFKSQTADSVISVQTPIKSASKRTPRPGSCGPSTPRPRRRSFIDKLARRLSFSKPNTQLPMTPEVDSTGRDCSGGSGHVPSCTETSPNVAPCPGKTTVDSKNFKSLLHHFSRSDKVTEESSADCIAMSSSSSLGNMASSRVSARRPVLAPKTANVAVPVPVGPPTNIVQKVNMPAVPPPPKRGVSTVFRAQKERRPVYMMYPQVYLDQATCSPVPRVSQKSPQREGSNILNSDPEVPGSYPHDREEEECMTTPPTKSVAVQVYKVVVGMLHLVFLDSWQAVWRLAFGTRV